jgi:hypothetical protein
MLSFALHGALLVERTFESYGRDALIIFKFGCN